MKKGPPAFKAVNSFLKVFLTIPHNGYHLNLTEHVNELDCGNSFNIV